MSSVLHLMTAVDFGGGEFIVSELAKNNTSFNSCVISLTHTKGLQKKLKSYEIPFFELTTVELDTSKKKYFEAIFFSFFKIWWLKKFILKNEISLIHCHGFSDLIIGVFIKKLTGSKLVYTHHTLMGSKSGIVGLVFSLLYSYVDKFTVVSQTVKKSVLNNFPSLSVTTIYNFIDPLFLSSELENRKNNKVFNYICVARLVQLKGHQSIIESFGKISESERENLRLYIVGTGPEESKLRELVSQFGLNNLVVFSGYLNHEALFHLYKEMHSSIFISKAEGFGVAVAEGLACGLPVVTLPECLAILEIADGAAIVSNSADLPRAILRLSNQDISELQVKARHRAQDFSIQRIVQEYALIYQEVLLNA